MKNHNFTTYGRIEAAEKFLKFSLLLTFGAFLLLSAAVTARAATFTVDRTDDANVSACTEAANDCTLRGAVAAANDSPENDTVIFDSNVFNSPQTITLTGGDLRIANNGTLTLNGSGANLLTVSGNNQSRIFSVVYLAGFTVSDLTITDGIAVGSIPARDGLGGGIYTEGTLELNRVVVKNCQSTGLYNFGFFATTINSSTFTGNRGEDGGAIRNLRSAPLIISNTGIDNNSAVNGGGIYSLGGLTLTDSLLRDNSASDSGGGIYGAGIALVNTAVNRNSAVNDGGGIRTNGNGLSISSSSLNGNSATTGGALMCLGTLTMMNSTIENNRARYGGGFAKYSSEAANINGSTISNNTATENSGGIFNINGTLTMINSTVSGNSAVQDGGGINNFAILNLINVTVANNRGSNGGGILNIPGTVNIRNTIIGDNSSGDFFGSLNSQGYNLIEDIGNTTITTTAPGPVITGQDPQLLPLGNYGGVTKTHALKPSSPAIDKGLLTTDPATAVDQRGLPRPFDFLSVANGSGDGSDIGAYERQALEPFLSTPFDFDGDGKADLSIFRPGTGFWYLLGSQNGLVSQQFGIAADKLVPADYDGDGKTDIAVYRNGTWYLLRSSAGFIGIAFGAPDDIPQPGDFDGDGKADIAVWRPSNGTWYVYNLATNQFTAAQFGAGADKPVRGDYDGDGKTDYAVFRPSNGTWYVNGSRAGFTAVQFGLADDKPVPADYDGDGKTDVAVFRPSTGTWYLNRSQAGFTSEQLGIATDLPVPADYNGDGKAEVSVYRNGMWLPNPFTGGPFTAAFGSATDRPVPNAYIQ